MNATNKEPTENEKIFAIAILITIILAFFSWVGSCGNEEGQREAKAPLTPEEQRKEDIEHCFNWDGSHIELTRLIKESMNDPDSYNHVKTVYYDQDSVLLVKTTFRGRNGFGGVVKQTVSAITHTTDCYVIEIVK